MNVLALMGSPKKKGATSTLAKAIIDGAEENGHHTEVIYLSDLTIKDCRGCMACRETAACVIRDDIAIVEEAIKKANVIILASPTHWGNMSGIMLRTIERLFGFLILEQSRGFPVKRHGNGKKAILVTACSTPSPFHWVFNQTRALFVRFHEVCRYSGIEIVGKIALPGTLSMKSIPEKYLAKAKGMGGRIGA